jgi:putative transposase
MNPIKTYKYKLRLSKNQTQRVSGWIGTSRFIYNLALETKICAWSYGVSLNKFELMKQLTDLKEIEWIKDVPSQSLQDVIERLDKAYQSFFKGSGFPKWAKKDEYKSITLKGIKQTENGFIFPKLGFVKLFKDRMPDGALKTAIIVKEQNTYFLSVTFESETKNIFPVSENQVIGLDMGVSYFLVDSDGCFVENPRHTKKYERKLRVENRALARKKKGSKSRQRQKEKLSKLHKKIANTRKDFLHKVSTRYVRQNHIIICEDLKVINMIKFGNLSKHIADASWSEFFSMLKYKSFQNGRIFFQINPKYTSQKCSNCGHVAKENRLTQSKFKCVSCKHEQNADLNASQNIKSEGIARLRQRGTLVRA